MNEIKWHAKLGHIGQNHLKRLAKAGLLGPIEKIDFPISEQCLAGKEKRLPFGKAKIVTLPLELIHPNIFGPMNIRERHGAQYFITFIDDFTRFSHVYLISHIYEALDCFKSYSALVENQLNTKIKSLRTDRGREYLSHLFKIYCYKKSISRQLTIPYTPQQNGVADRMNSTLFDMIRSMIAQAKLSISFWGDVLMTAAYILNRVPSKSIPSTPYELWKGEKPDLNIMRP